MREVARGRRKYTVEQMATMESNGIAYRTFIYRIHAGWKMEDALTIPTMSRRDTGRIMKNEYGIATRKIRDAFVKKGARV